MMPDPFATVDPSTRTLYSSLLEAAAKLGKFDTEMKKTCVHLVRKSAFAGVHPRKKHLNVTIKATRAFDDPRVFKSDQVSKSRWHHDVRLESPEQIDAQLLGWLKEAYEISA